MNYSKYKNMYRKPLVYQKRNINQMSDILKSIKILDHGQIRPQYGNNHSMPTSPFRSRNNDVSYVPLNLRGNRNPKMNTSTSLFKNVPTPLLTFTNKKSTDVESQRGETEIESEPMKTEDRIESEPPDPEFQSDMDIKETKEDRSASDDDFMIDIMEECYPPEPHLRVDDTIDLIIHEAHKINHWDTSVAEVSEDNSVKMVESKEKDDLKTDFDELFFVINKEIEKNANHSNQVEIEGNDLEQNLGIEKNGGLEDIILGKSKPVFDSDIEI